MLKMPDREVEPKSSWESWREPRERMSLDAEVTAQREALVTLLGWGYKVCKEIWETEDPDRPQNLVAAVEAIVPAAS